MSDILFLGTRKGLFSFERNAGAWKIGRHWFPGVQVPMVLADPRDGCLYAAVAHGHFGNKLHRSTDRGGSWQELAPPAYPPKPSDAPDVMCPVRKIPIPWSLELIWSLEPGGKEEPGVIWCGTIPGGLFRSSDRGDTWQFVESLWGRPERAKWFGGGYDWPGIHSICIDPRDSAHVTVGVSCGGVWTSADRGATWKQTAHGMRADYMPPESAYDPDIQDPHRVVQCGGAPGHYWAQHHNGIFRSTDGAQRWEAVPKPAPSDFGFAVAVHPRDPKTAWFVPATSDETRIPVGGQVVVNRTRDGGNSFETCRHGLPQEHAYDLVYRHALEVDPSGERLAMGSTTGSVWVSENQGDSWRVLAEHLPPVFSVRFA